MLNECEQLWASGAAQALDARLTNHVVAPSVNPALVTLTHEYYSGPIKDMEAYEGIRTISFGTFNAWRD